LMCIVVAEYTQSRRRFELCDCFLLVLLLFNQVQLLSLLCVINTLCPKK